MVIIPLVQESFMTRILLIDLKIYSVAKKLLKAWGHGLPMQDG